LNRLQSPRFVRSPARFLFSRPTADFDLHLDEAKEELHVLLTNVDRQHGHHDESRHDEQIRNGTAQHLARCLHRLVLVQRSGRNEPAPSQPQQAPLPRAATRTGFKGPPPPAAYRSRLDPSRAVQVTALCRALHLIVTRCTAPVLQAHLSKEDETMLVPSVLTKDLLSSLPIVIHLLATSTNDLSNASYSLQDIDDNESDGCCFVRRSTSTASCLVRLSGLGSAIGIVERIVPLVHELPTSPCSGSTQLRISLLGHVLLSLLGLTTDAPDAFGSRRGHRPKHSHVPSDLRVDAACALTSLLPPMPASARSKAKQQESLPQPRRRFVEVTWLLEDRVSAALIATLSTGAAMGVDAADEMPRRCIVGLARLAWWNSGVMASKLLSRRRVVKALCDHLLMVPTHDLTKAPPSDTKAPPSVSSAAKQHALACVELSKALLEHCRPSGYDSLAMSVRETSKSRHKSNQTSIQENVQLLVGAIIRRLLQESHEGTKMALVDVLALLVEKEWLVAGSDAERSKLPSSLHTVTSVLNVLFLFASSASGSEEFVVGVASRYLQAVRVHETAAVMSTAVDLLASPFPKVRELTFQALIDLCFWKIEEAKLLLGPSSLLDRLGHALGEGNGADCAKAVTISKHLVVFHHDARSSFCGNANYVASLVALVTTEPIKNRIAYGDAVDVILELMSVPNQLHRFVRHDEKLLPWLVKFANRTSDEELKRRAAGIVVRYSTVLLKGLETPGQ
jgi:hypothetical protein